MTQHKQRAQRTLFETYLGKYTAETQSDSTKRCRVKLIKHHHAKKFQNHILSKRIVPGMISREHREHCFKYISENTPPKHKMIRWNDAKLNFQCTAVPTFFKITFRRIEICRPSVHAHLLFSARRWRRNLYQVQNKELFLTDPQLFQKNAPARFEWQRKRPLRDWCLFIRNIVSINLSTPHSCR